MKVFGFLIFLAFNLNASVWTVTEKWTDEIEKQYSNWVSEKWTNDIFKNPDSDLVGLKTDCADATYTMRAYFAYLKRLPFSFHRFDGTIVNQNTSQFDKITDPLGRFRAFLNSMYDLTSTYTLSKDTFPIPISREYLIPGTIYLSPGIHSYQITGLDEFGIPNTLSSTVPKDDRILFNHYGFPFYLPQEFQKKSDGYRSFRKIDDLNSSEQFELSKKSNGDFIEFQKLMIKKLALKTEPFERRIKRIKGNLCFFSRERAVLVADAYVKHFARNNQCFGPAEFDDYSTYIRDKKLKNYFVEYKKMTHEPEWQNTTTEAKKILLSSFLREIPDSDCTIETSLPRKPVLSLADIYEALESSALVSDPNATMAQRWGVDPYKPQCPIY